MSTDSRIVWSSDQAVDLEGTDHCAEHQAVVIFHACPFSDYACGCGERVGCCDEHCC